MKKTNKKFLNELKNTNLFKKRFHFKNKLFFRDNSGIFCAKNTKNKYSKTQNGEIFELDYAKDNFEITNDYPFDKLYFVCKYENKYGNSRYYTVENREFYLREYISNFNNEGISYDLYSKKEDNLSEIKQDVKEFELTSNFPELF